MCETAGERKMTEEAGRTKECGCVMGSTSE